MRPCWFVLCSFVAILHFGAELSRAADSAEGAKESTSLSARYPHVARDMLRLCEPREGFWVDLGAGSGGVALALLEERDNPIVLLDPDAEAMQRGLEKARQQGKANRLSAVVASAEAMPLPSDSVDWLVSRGSIFFWDDSVRGLEEVYRVLRPGAWAMIGGGAGSGFPKEAAGKLIAERKAKLKGDQAERWQEFIELRKPEQMQAWGEAAKLPDFQVLGQGAISSDDPDVGQGVWIVFQKHPEFVTKKAEDGIAVAWEQEKRIYTVSSPSGIGSGTIIRSGSWPSSVVLRLKLRGLESLTIRAGDLVWSASVLSHGNHEQLLSVRREGREAKVKPADPLWTEIVAVDAGGKATSGSAGEGGYFEVPLPAALLESQPRMLELQWIDFYR